MVSESFGSGLVSEIFDDLVERLLSRGGVDDGGKVRGRGPPPVSDSHSVVGEDLHQSSLQLIPTGVGRDVGHLELCCLPVSGRKQALKREKLTNPVRDLHSPD